MKTRTASSLKNQHIRKALLPLFLVLLFISTPAIIAYAAVVLNKPVNGAFTSGFKMRMHPIKKTMRPHKGQDIGVPIGTPVDIGGPVTGMACKNDPNGYGTYAVVTYECDVQAKFAHLSKCDASSRTAISGNSGGSTGPHLHHEILLGNAVVDPQEAYGKDLCDPAVREQLIKDANEKLNGLAGKDGTVSPATDDGSMTHVPPDPNNPGGTIDDGNGGTITLPPGGGYTIIETPDGRVNVVPDAGGGGGTGPILPPGDPADLTPEGTVEHEVTGCATDTWKAMVNQSVLQARREMAMNERFIAKADSVMAYACLQEPLDRVRKDLGPIFSETKRWVNVEVDIIGKTVTLNKELGEQSLDGALVGAAYNPYETWIRSNFSHDFLGGLMEGEVEEEGHNHTHDQAYSPCSTMQDVWKAAKCSNMKDEPMFPKFEQLIENSSDPRKYPHGYECNYTGITQEMIDTAKGKEVKFDKVKTYLDMIYPDEEGNCHPAIMTGITVSRQEGQERITEEKTYPDGLCITLGCSYQKNGDGGGECVVK